MWLAAGQWVFFPGIPVSSTNNTDRHDIARILLKVVLNTITQPLKNRLLKPHHICVPVPNMSCRCFFLFYVQRFAVRGDCSLCWYWWNCLPSLFKLSYHNFHFTMEHTHTHKQQIILQKIYILHTLFLLDVGIAVA